MFELVDPPKNRFWTQTIWPLSWLIVTAIAAWLRPDASGHGTHRQLGLPACPSVQIFGRPCPGCGLTTSWTNFVHGHFAESFANNLLGPFLYVGFTLVALGHLIALIKRKAWNTNTKPFNWASTILLSLFLTYGAIRWVTMRYDNRAIVDQFITNQKSK